MSAPKKSLRPKMRPKRIEQEAAEAGAVARGNRAAERLARETQSFMGGGMARPRYGMGGETKPRGCGAAQTSGFGGGQTY
jgi:hypothetical protein